jgi:hypothetical protein
MITNAKPTGDDCEKCGNPNKMYWCQSCEHNDESPDKCILCNGKVEVDFDYHLECDSEFTKEL